MNNNKKIAVTVSVEPKQFEYLKMVQDYYKLSMAKTVRKALQILMDKEFADLCEKLNRRYKKMA